MIEYRTERVDPQYEDAVIKDLSAFGWQLVSSQETYNESTELVGVEVKSYGAFMQGFTGSDGKINIKQRKNITNYVTLKFSRDTNMPEYARLKDLNEEYESNARIFAPHKPVKRTLITAIGIAIIVVSIILALIEHNTAEIWEICVCVIFPVVMLPLTILGWIKYKKDLNYFYNIAERQREIYEEAQSLIV